MIRKATRDDVQVIWDVRIAAIRAQCCGFYSAEILDAWTNGDPTEQFALWVESSFYVAVDGDRVLGSGAIDLESGQIDAIFVLPELMSKGIGRQLLACLEDMAIAAGLDLVILNSTLNAAPFYRKCGYEGNAVGIYSSPRGFNLDCVPMRKVLRRSAVDAQRVNRTVTSNVGPIQKLGKMMGIVNRENAEHYTWGGICDGWHLLKSSGLSVIQERIPPGGAEVKHYHEHAHQFFFVLSGNASIEIENKTLVLGSQQGISIPPKTPHRLLNETKEELLFLVVSAPMSHGDRVLVA